MGFKPLSSSTDLKLSGFRENWKPGKGWLDILYCEGLVIRSGVNLTEEYKGFQSPSIASWVRLSLDGTAFHDRVVADHFYKTVCIARSTDTDVGLDFGVHFQF